MFCGFTTAAPYANIKNSYFFVLLKQDGKIFLTPHKKPQLEDYTTHYHLQSIDRIVFVILEAISHCTNALKNVLQSKTTYLLNL